jgi:hypothetical protein
VKRHLQEALIAKIENDRIVETAREARGAERGLTVDVLVGARHW